MIRLHGVIYFKSSYGVVFKRACLAVQRHTSGKQKAPLGFEPRISCLLDRNFNQLSCVFRKSSHFHNKINSAPDMRNLFRTFNSLLCPPSPPPTTSLTADDFATFFTDKTKTISSQFSPSLTQDLQPTRSTAQTPIFSFCPLTEAEVSKLLLSSHPTTCPLDPIPSHLFQAISPTLLSALTHIINTSLLTGIFPTAFKQTRVTPLL